MTIGTLRPAAAKLGARITSLALIAVVLSALSACSAANDSMPGGIGILPNGIVFDPYHG
jgi:hypothetical protein